MSLSRGSSQNGAWKRQLAENVLERRMTVEGGQEQRHVECAVGLSESSDRLRGVLREKRFSTVAQ